MGQNINKRQIVEVVSLYNLQIKQMYFCRIQIWNYYLFYNHWKKTYLFERCTLKTICSSNRTCQEHELFLWLRKACIIVHFESMKLWAELSLCDLQKAHSVHTLWCLLAEHVQFNTPRGTWTSSIYPRALREMMNLLPGESQWISMKSDQREKDTDWHGGDVVSSSTQPSVNDLWLGCESRTQSSRHMKWGPQRTFRWNAATPSCACRKHTKWPYTAS